MMNIYLNIIGMLSCCYSVANLVFKRVACVRYSRCPFANPGFGRGIVGTIANWLRAKLGTDLDPSKVFKENK